MQAFKSNEGDLLGVRPTHLVVPPALETAAKLLIESPFTAPGVANPLYNTVKVVVAPLLA
jgi:phage major head subunit gpT-like protein